VSESDDFEANLRDRLAGRSREIAPASDLDDLGVRVGVARRKRQRAIVAGVGGLCIVLFAVAGAFALDDGGGDPVQVAGQGTRRSPTTTSAPATTTTTVAGAVAPGGRPTRPGEAAAVTTTTISADDQLVHDIEQLVVTLLDPNTTDAQRMALVASADAIRPSFAALRQHERYESFGDIVVTPGDVELAPDRGTAELNYGFDTDGRNGGIRVSVVVTDGVPQLTRASYCSTIAYVTEFLGGPTLTCDKPTTTTSTTTSVPAVTSTTVAP
jgi:hypothetical protein